MNELSKHWQVRLVTLILLVSIPQLGYTIIIPSIPDLYHYFNEPGISINHIVTAYILGFSVSVLLAGILASRYGLFYVQVCSLCVFMLASISLCYVDNIYLFIIIRFFQALGGCVSTVLTRLTVGEMIREDKRHFSISILATATAITPLVSPILGGSLSEIFSWKSCFYFLTVFSFLSLIIFVMVIPKDVREPKVSTSNVAHDYVESLLDKTFIVFAISITFVSMIHVFFITYSADFLSQLFHFGTVEISYYLAFVTLGYLIGVSLSKKMGELFGFIGAIKKCASIITALGVIEIIYFAFYSFNGVLITIGFFLIMVAIGIVVPISQIGLLYVREDIVTNASSLFFFMQLAGSGLYVGIASYFFNLNVLSLFFYMAVPAVILLIILFFYSLSHNEIIAKQ